MAFLRTHSYSATHSKGFTLVELLIVIAILAVLSIAVVMVINPAELLKQSRDSTRYADIDAINKALSVTAIDNLSLGTASKVYIGIADTSATCANLGLPTLPTGWTYNCVTTTTLRKVDGTGWLPVNLSSASIGSPLSALPIDPVNATTSGNYYAFTSSGSSWNIKASQFESAKYTAKNQNGYSLGNVVPPHVFPENWVKVPGNSSFGTSDFYVMKYDAKCISGTAPLTSPVASGAYDNNSQACVGNYYPASTPDGFPIANISHDTAKTYCANIGAHLLTNDEYMTIVRNAEQVSSNWTLGTVGSGAIFSGHGDNVPSGALAADPFGDDGYYGTGNSSPSNQRRILTLSNGSIIWDFAGNIWQHLQRSTSNVGDATTTITLPACSNGMAGWEFCQYDNTGTYISAWTSDVTRASVAPSNSSWNSAQGVGNTWTYGAGGVQAAGATVFIRGGDSGVAWGASGSFSLMLRDWFPATKAAYTGFRCAR